MEKESSSAATNLPMLFSDTFTWNMTDSIPNSIIVRSENRDSPNLCPDVHIFFDKGCFITSKSNYIQPLHNQDAHSRLFVSSDQSYIKQKEAKYISER
jgi:alpha-D-ribose 1-methylphosphonate 5-phosphate C-P lyase